MSVQDYQRSKVYNWENDRFPIHDHRLSLDECRELASEMYGKQVRVKDGRGCRSAFAYEGRACIGLPRWARNRYVIAHEIAHIITERKHPDSAAHGGLFMHCYLELLERFCGEDYNELRFSCTMAEIRVTGPLRSEQAVPVERPCNQAACG